MATGSPERAWARARVQAQSLGVHPQPSFGHGLDERGCLAVPQLADVEVTGDAVGARGADPAQHDVAGRLHQPLPLHDPLAVVGEPAPAEEPLEHRRLGLFDLQEEGIVAVVADHEHHPRPSADAADPDHLAGAVHVAETFEEQPAIIRQAATVRADDHAQRVDERPGLVGADKVVDRHDQRRVGDDPRLAVDEARELGEGLHAVLAACCMKLSRRACVGADRA